MTVHDVLGAPRVSQRVLMDVVAREILADKRTTPRVFSTVEEIVHFVEIFRQFIIPGTNQKRKYT